MEQHQQSSDVTSSWWRTMRARGLTGLTRLARAVLREDQDDHGDQNDQEDGLLTMVLFVALGLCIIMVLAEFRA